MNKGKTTKSKTQKNLHLNLQRLKLSVCLKVKNQKILNSFEDTGVIVVDDDLIVDKEKELEERRAFFRRSTFSGFI